MNGHEVLLFLNTDVASIMSVGAARVVQRKETLRAAADAVPDYVGRRGGLPEYCERGRR
ncbi:hypothetical protein [Nocardia sp. CY41]|uniref:hypothetical protein n=1 Tax=Nocardia sp. CY41 TaxID=2608686 RepID=UPI00135B1032|nr:hypothetical protein [Nocardia sp. CY41]